MISNTETSTNYKKAKVKKRKFTLSHHWGKFKLCAAAPLHGDEIIWWWCPPPPSPWPLALNELTLSKDGPFWSGSDPLLLLGTQTTLRGVLFPSDTGATVLFFFITRTRLVFWNWVTDTEILWELQIPIFNHVVAMDTATGWMEGHVVCFTGC